MKIACVTTTINVPRVLALYAKCNPDVCFFVVVDKKTPEEAVAFCDNNIANLQVVSIKAQEKWKCSELIGWNCIQRRNIGFLEALKWDADVVVSIDDDNVPISADYFEDFESGLGWVFNKRLPPNSFYYPDNWAGMQATSPSGWFDVGELLQPRAPHRGFPHSKRTVPVFEPVMDAKVGVCAGICLGDPDIGAVERIANAPTVHGVSELLRAGVVVDSKQTWTVFNSQNTAIVRELLPAWFMLTGVGRFDDIYASLIVQRIMRERDMFVHFGKPFVWQQRNQHNLLNDLELEIIGMQNIIAFAEHIDRKDIKGLSVVEQVRALYKVLDHWILIDAECFEAAMAWCDDCESILK